MGANAGIACLRGSNRIAAGLRAGRDVAERDRPGGDQRQIDLRVTWIGSFTTGTVLVDGVISFQRDNHGFSALLENNAARHLDRANLHVEYAHPIASGWAVLLSADLTRQRSNLELFEITGRAAYIGLRWQSLQ
jgi:hypothetical protein